MRLLWFWLRGHLGLLTGADVCDFSAHYRDVHDYPVNKGGDGIPCHFYTYKCWRCGKRFTL